MAESIMLHSFTSGELSPGLFGRTDLTKYASGCALARNFFIDQGGGLSNRPGTAFVGRSKQGTTNPQAMTPPSSQFGAITGWVNPRGMVSEDISEQLCSGQQILFTSLFNSVSDKPGSLLILLENQGGTPETIYPGKLNVSLIFDDLFATNGNHLISFVVAIADRNIPANFINIPTKGFPLAFTWDFSGANWTAAIYMGMPNGTWQRVDNFHSWNANVGSGSTGSVPMTSPLDPTFSFCNSFASTNHNFGGARGFYFNFGSDRGGVGNTPLTIPPPNPLASDMWDSGEFSQWWFGFGQSPDFTTLAGASLWYDPTSIPPWAPRNLGALGTAVTGVQPPYYLASGYGATLANGGSFRGALTIYAVTTSGTGIPPVSIPPGTSSNAVTIPPTGGYQAVGVEFGINNGAIVALPTFAQLPLVNAACPLPASPQLIPFVFSQGQTYMLEFGTQYMRVIKNGGYVLDQDAISSIAGVTQSTAAVMTTTTTNSFTNSDWVFVSGVGGMTQLNGRTFIVSTASTNSFTMEDLDSNPLDTTHYGAFTTGGTVSRIFTLPTPYLSTALGTLKFAQSADVMTLVHPQYAPANLTRTDDDDWALTTITFQPGINPPATVSSTASMAGSYTYRYVVTAISANTAEESRASTASVITSAQMSQVTGANIRLNWSPVAGASGYNIYRQPEVTTVPDLGMLYGFAGSTTGVYFTDQNVLPDFTRTPPMARNPFAVSTILYITVTGAGSGFTSGTVMTLNDSTGSGWQGFLETASGGGLAAVITQYGGQNWSNATTASFSGGATATVSITIGASTGTYPSAVTYYQQREVYAGSSNSPNTLWMSQTGNFNNMDVSSPTRDSDAITATLASLQQNKILWLVPLQSGLMAGTAAGPWLINGGASGAPVTPSNIVAQPQAVQGASSVIPITINQDLIFLESTGNVVRDITFNFYFNIFTGNDTTVLSRHLFYGHNIVNWAYQDKPWKIIWAVREDGVVLTETFLKEQEIFGWTHADTQGQFFQVGNVREGLEDAIYFIVQRTIPGINGGNAVYYVERLASRNFFTAWNSYNADVTAAWFLDCAAQYPVNTPNACLTISASQALASTNSFSTSSVGSVIRVNGGVLTVATYSGPTLVFTNTQVNPTSTQHATSGTWTLTAPVQTVTGLWHLEGAQVYALSNGSVEGPFTVANGSITLSVASDIVTVGLLPIAQFQSLYIDTGLPTTQGKRKTIPGVTMRVWDSRGLMVGPEFSTMTAMKERNNEAMGQPIALQTGDERINIQSQWRTEGQVVAQQSYPLPTTIVAVIPEMLIGDTEAPAK